LTLPDAREKFLLIDGSSLVYRAFFALPLLQTRHGVYTNAVYGFTTMLLRLLEEEKPDYAVVAFDKGGPTFRHRLFEGYKAKREKTPRELLEQLPRVRELLAALRLPVAEEEGLEADDLIGTLARLASAQAVKPVIVSGDADVFQLVDLPAEVIFTRRGISQTEKYTGRELSERYGLTAQQFIDYKALKGDQSDNIPGVPGVGEKTAKELLGSFASLDGIYRHLDQLKNKNLRERLATYREQAYLSRQLATIELNAPVSFSLDDYRLKSPDYQSLKSCFEQLEFKSLLEKLPPADISSREPVPDLVPGDVDPKQLTAGSYVVITGPRELLLLQTALSSFRQAALLSDPPDCSWQDEPKGMALSVNGRLFYLPLHAVPPQELAVFLDDSALVLSNDAKNWINLCCRWFGKEPSGRLFDVSLAAYLLDPLANDYSLDRLAACYLPANQQAEVRNQSAGSQEPRSPAHDGLQGAAVTAAVLTLAARAMSDLYPLLRSRLAEYSLDKLYDEIELPLSFTLARMERTGIAVDTAVLNELRKELSVRVVSLEKEIFVLAGETFNLNSPKQLGYILFEKLSLPVLKKTKTGFSTDAEVLEELAPHHEIVVKILEYRTLTKLLATYLDGLSRLINPGTGRIHTTFNQTVTATGRLSSTEPNLQNIPIRLEEGRRVRRAFVPGRKGSVLLSADYSQIELRILAHISGDQALLDSFRREEDIHRRTASEVFAVDLEQVTQQMRDRAKAVNFGIIYGISDYGLSRQLAISRQEARLLIERYLDRYPGVCRYLREVVEKARQTGYVTTLLGRRRLLPGINSRNFAERSFAERTALNTPLQGTAADIIKLAMLHVDKALKPYERQAQMLLQVHDELVFEVDEEVLPSVSKLVRLEMEGAFPLSVPLTVEVKTGYNWAEMKKQGYC
jgi:DNA polymerase-1